MRSSSKSCVYHDSGINPENLSPREKGTLNRLYNREFKELRLHQLSVRGYWTIYVNREDRLLLKLAKINGKKEWVLVRQVSNHEYDEALNNLIKSQGKRETQTVKVIQEHILDDNKALVLNGDEAWLPEKRETEEEFQSVYQYEGCYLQPNEIQQAIIEGKHQRSMAVMGSAGSGKSYAALAQILKYAERCYPETKTKKILYVAKSPLLVAQMRLNWHENISAQNYLDAVVFKTYDQLIHELLPDTKEMKPADAETFRAFIKPYIDQQRRLNKTYAKSDPKQVVSNDFLNHTLTMYWECRIACGFESLEDYLYFPLDESLLANNNEKTWLYNHFCLYMQYLERPNNNLFDAAFFNPRLNQLFELVVIDEGQQLSLAQFKALIAMAQIKISIDHKEYPNVRVHEDYGQGMTDVARKELFIKKFLKAKEGLVKVEKLPISYRNKPAVARLANKVIDICSHVTPRKYQPMNFEENCKETGSAIVDTKCDDAILVTRFKETADFAIVTHPGLIDHANTLFPKTPVIMPEDILGLQFKHILIYRLLEDDIFVQVSAAIESNKKDDEHGLACKKLFVAISRAMESVTIAEFNNLHKVRHLIRELEGATPVVTAANSQLSSTQHSTESQEEQREELLDSAVRFARNGLMDQAVKILEKNLGYKPAQIQEFKERNELKLSEAYDVQLTPAAAQQEVIPTPPVSAAQPMSTPAAATASSSPSTLFNNNNRKRPTTYNEHDLKKLIAIAKPRKADLVKVRTIFQDREAEEYLFEIDLDGECFFTRLCDHEEYRNTVVAELFPEHLKRLSDKFTIGSLNRRSYDPTVIEASEQEMPPIFWLCKHTTSLKALTTNHGKRLLMRVPLNRLSVRFQTYSVKFVELVGNSTLFLFTTSENVISILSHLLDCYGHILRDQLDPSYFVTRMPSHQWTSMLSNLIASPTGMPVLEKLLVLHNELAITIQPHHLLPPNGGITKHVATKDGQKCLKLLSGLNHVISTISLSDYSAEDLEKIREFLYQQYPNLGDMNKWIRNFLVILEKNVEQFAPNLESNIEKLIKQKDVNRLFNALVDVTFFGITFRSECLFHILFHTPKTREIMLGLIRKNKDFFVNHITRQALCGSKLQMLTSNGSFFEYASDKIDLLEMIEEMFKKNGFLLKTLPLFIILARVNNSIALFHLAANKPGLTILRKLFFDDQGWPKITMPSLFTNNYIHYPVTNRWSNLLEHLSSSAQGREILLMLFEYPEFTDKIADEVICRNSKKESRNDSGTCTLFNLFHDEHGFTLLSLIARNSIEKRLQLITIIFEAFMTDTKEDAESISRFERLLEYAEKNPRALHHIQLLFTYHAATICKDIPDWLFDNYEDFSPAQRNSRQYALLAHLHTTAPGRLIYQTMLKEKKKITELIVGTSTSSQPDEFSAADLREILSIRNPNDVDRMTLERVFSHQKAADYLFHSDFNGECLFVRLCRHTGYSYYMLSELLVKYLPMLHDKFTTESLNGREPQAEAAIADMPPIFYIFSNVDLMKVLAHNAYFLQLCTRLSFPSITTKVKNTAVTPFYYLTSSVHGIPILEKIVDDIALRIDAASLIATTTVVMADNASKRCETSFTNLLFNLGESGIAILDELILKNNQLVKLLALDDLFSIIADKGQLPQIANVSKTERGGKLLDIISLLKPSLSPVQLSHYGLNDKDFLEMQRVLLIPLAFSSKLIREQIAIIVNTLYSNQENLYKFLNSIYKEKRNQIEISVYLFHFFADTDPCRNIYTGDCVFHKLFSIDKARASLIKFVRNRKDYFKTNITALALCGKSVVPHRESPSYFTWLAVNDQELLAFFLQENSYLQKCIPVEIIFTKFNGQSIFAELFKTDVGRVILGDVCALKINLPKLFPAEVLLAKTELSESTFLTMLAGNVTGRNILRTVFHMSRIYRQISKTYGETDSHTNDISIADKITDEELCGYVAKVDGLFQGSCVLLNILNNNTALLSITSLAESTQNRARFASMIFDAFMSNTPDNSTSIDYLDRLLCDAAMYLQVPGLNHLSIYAEQLVQEFDARLFQSEQDLDPDFKSSAKYKLFTKLKECKNLKPLYDAFHAAGIKCHANSVVLKQEGSTIRFKP